MAEETQYTANTGMATISTANSNLNGTGTLVSVLTAGSEGTLIKSITIIANGDTTQGMVRLFLTTRGTSTLLKEIEIPAVDASSVDKAFQTKLDLNFTLKSGYVLHASTQNAESFNVIAEGMDWNYYTTSVRTDTTQYTALTGLAAISTASTKVSLLTAGSNGCSVESITVKAIENTVDGIISLYIYNGTTYYLFNEIKVTAVTRSGIADSYEYTLVFEDDFELKSGYSLYVATMQNQLFRVTAEGLNWTYPA